MNGRNARAPGHDVDRLPPVEFVFKQMSVRMVAKSREDRSGMNETHEALVREYFLYSLVKDVFLAGISEH
jgi:hypothetical protein